MPSSRIDILINARNNATGELRDVNQQIGGLSKVSSVAGKALAGMGIALGAMELGRFALDAAKSAAAAARVAESFGGLAGNVGADANRMMDAMRSMSAGMINDTDLMLSANRAMMLGVATNADEMSRLLEVAGERGQAMGLSMSQAFNDIVTGIGRQSAMILDNLGIVIDAEQSYANYAAQLNKTADDLSDVEKKHALLNAVLAESDGKLDASVSSYEQLGSAMSNLKDELGELAAPSVSAGVAALAASVSALNDSLNKGQEKRGAVLDEREVKALENSIGLLRDQLTAAKNDLAGLEEGTWQYDDALYEVEQIQNRLDAALGDYGTQLGDVTRATDSYAGSLDSLREQSRLAAEANAQMAQDAQNSAALMSGFNVFTPEQIQPALSATEEFADEIERLARNVEAAAFREGFSVGGAVSEYTKAKQALAGFVDTYNDLGQSSETIMNLLSEQSRVYIGDIQDMMTETQSATDSAGQFGSVGAAAMLQVQSAAAGLLGTLGAVRQGAAGMISDVLSALGQANASIERSVSTQAVSLAPKIGDSAALDYYNQNVQAARENWAGLAAEIQSGNLTQQEANILQQSYINGLDDTIQAQLRAATTATSAASSTRSSVQSVASEYNNLASKIQSIFGIGQVAGIDANDLLPREDAVNENARRLADIAVNGLKGQDWLSEFAAEAPNVFAALRDAGNPQEEAARLLRDFQDGLLGDTAELIDRDAAKERVRRMIMGESATAELANELAAELSSEMGVALGSVQQTVGQLLGGGAAGNTEMIAKVREAETGMTAAGRDAGKAYAASFIDIFANNVPRQALDILADLITPIVQDRLHQESSRSAAAGAGY